MAMREAVVVNRATGQPVMDLDPVDVRVTEDGFADPRDNELMKIFDTMVSFETEDGIEITVSLVWSDTLLSERVRIVCPTCDDVAIVDDETAIEEDSDGTCALVCCDCLD